MTLQTITVTRILLLSANAFLTGANFMALMQGIGSPPMNYVAVLAGIFGVIAGGNMILCQTLANGETQETKP